MYLRLGSRSVFSGIMGSLPNMRKADDSLLCSFGRKLYAAQASGITSTHSRLGLTFLPMQVFKNAWNPSIFPFAWGKYGGE